MTKTMNIERTILSSIQKRLHDNKVIVITGARRVGKTFLLNQIASLYEGVMIRLNGEDLDARTLLENRSIANYRRLIGDASLLMIDEAQVIPDIGKKMKLFIDEISHLTILLTGSSALTLRNNTGEPLTGRQYLYHLYPISQLELNQHEGLLETRQRLEDRLIFGAYPELLQMEKSKDRIFYLKEVVNSYLLKDLLAFEGIRNAGKLLALLKLIAFQVGSEVSYQELSTRLDLNKNTIEHYLDLLSKVFVIYKLGGYSGNLRREVTKSSKWYFYDNGIRNTLVSDHSPLSLRKDTGNLWENYVSSERIKKNAYRENVVDYYFWRTYDQQEIDWIEYENGRLRAFEFKWSDAKAKVPVAFKKSYPDSPFEVITRENYLPFIA